MCREPARIRALCFVSRAAIVIVALGAGPGFAAPVEITTCGQTVTGRAVLSGDLDCSSTGLDGVELNNNGTLDLNGHTLTAASQRVAVHCIGSCTVRGPGTLTGADARGVLSRKNLKIKDVTLTGLNGAISGAKTFGKGRVTLDRCTISNVGWGIHAEVPVRLSKTTVTGVANTGIVAGDGGVASGLPCTGVSVVLKRSSVTGSGTDPLCGVDTSSMGYLGRNCADIITCEKPPRLLDSTCTTSCAGGTGLPCTSWGVCSGD